VYPLQWSFSLLFDNWQGPIEVIEGMETIVQPSVIGAKATVLS
jgi:hypothetical protein